jgi:gamma-glutamylaminecyclotransferase
VAHLVFVYGTLMKGELHHTTIEHARFVRKAQTLPHYEFVKIDYYPALLPDGQKSISGELYEVDDQTLRRLDVLEDVPTYYERHTIELADGSSAYAYVMPRERAQRAVPIPSNSFRTPDK